MSEQEKLAFLEEVLDVEEGSLTADAVLSEMDEWDSLGTLSLTIAVKDKFDKNLTANTIRGFQTAKDICDYIP